MPAAALAARVARGASTSRAASAASCVVHGIAAGERRRGARHAQRQQRRAHRADAQRQRRSAKRFDQRVVGAHLRQPRRAPRRLSATARAQRPTPRARANAGQVELEREAIAQRRRRPLVVGHRLRRAARRRSGPACAARAVALQRHHAGVEHGGQARRGGRVSRSAIASSTTPPSASASRPRSATGRPRRSVAARSSPPSRRSSRDVSGTRRTARPAAGARAAAPASGRAPGPASARSDTADGPAGSTANSAAASTASAHGEIAGTRCLAHAPNSSLNRTLDARGRTRIVERIAAQPVAQRRSARRAADAHRRPPSSPSRLASARAARISVSSPRRPSVPRLMHSCAARSSAASGTLTVGQPLRAAFDACAGASRLPSSTARRTPRDRARRRRAGARPRRASARSVGVLTSTDRPKRSSNCGRSSPSSGIAAADQHEARRVAHAQALALDDVLAGRRDVDQQVDQVILEQIHFVDVEKAAMRAREQAGLERLHALRERALEVERADDAVLGGAERQVDHRHRRHATLERRLRVTRAALVAPRAFRGRDRSRSGSRRRRASAAAAPPARAPRSTCRCRGRRRPARRRSTDRPPRSAAPASSRPGRRSRKRERVGTWRKSRTWAMGLPVRSNGCGANCSWCRQ